MHDPHIFGCLSGAAMRRLRFSGICDWLGLPTRLRLSPEGYSLGGLIRQTRAALAAGTRLFVLSYHNFSLLPGATEYVGTEPDRRAFLATVDGHLRFFLALGGRVDIATRVAAALTPGQNASNT